MAESRRFSQGDKQQEATYLHFQRPAPAASPPPPNGQSCEGLPGIPPFRGRGRDPGEGLLGLPSPQAPLHPLEDRIGGRALDDQIGALAASERASRPKWGQRRPPQASGSSTKGRLGAGPGRRGPGLEGGFPGLRKSRSGSRGGLEAPTGRGAPDYWLPRGS